LSNVFKKYDVKYFFILAMLVYLVSYLGQNSLAEELKARIRLEGVLADFRITEKPVIYYRDTLWKYINGGAVAYLAYGFKEAVTFTATHHESGLEFVVDIYDMGKQIHAYGIYSFERSQEGVPVEWGCDGRLYGNALYFWQDRYYVKIMAYDTAQGTEKLLSKIAGSISRKLPDVDASPKQLAVFPEIGRIKDSDQYIKTDVLGQDYFHDGFRMEYDRKGQRYTILLIEGTTREETAVNLNKYLAYLNEMSKQGNELTGLGEQAFTGKDSFYGPVILSRKNRFIIGVFGLPDMAAAKKIILAMLEKLEKIDKKGYP
jgi:hypothetical protein